MSVIFLGREFPHPLITCPCPLAWGTEDLLRLANTGVSIVTTKSVTVEPRAGNPRPFDYYTDTYSLNAVGLANDGIQAHLGYVADAKKHTNTPFILNIAGFSAQEFAHAVEQGMASDDIWAVELNLSCPNTEKDIIAENPKLVAEVLTAVAPYRTKPLGVKVNPCTDPAKVQALAEVFTAAKVDFITATNTLGGCLALDENGNPRISATYGGMAGPALKLVSLATVHHYRQALPAHIPIIGLGGVTTAQDVRDLQAAGATMVGLASAAMHQGLDHVAQLAQDL